MSVRLNVASAILMAPFHFHEGGLHFENDLFSGVGGGQLYAFRF
jgi:hypothetical protein